MDNYALFSAGGMDFLLINLEFNAPDYAIDWAKRVLAAYPNRRPSSRRTATSTTGAA